MSSYLQQRDDQADEERQNEIRKALVRTLTEGLAASLRWCMEQTTLEHIINDVEYKEMVKDKMYRDDYKRDIALIRAAWRTYNKV